MTTENTTATESAPITGWACPAGKLIIRADAPREEWLALRNTGLGASDGSKLLGLSPYGDQFTVWEEKTGRAPAREDNEAMYWGRALEPLLIARFTEDTGITVRRSGMLRSRIQPELLYTPDGITEDGGIIECKTFGQWVASDWINEDGEQVVPDHAYVQVQQGMFVTGRNHAWVVGLGAGRDWHVRRVERDEETISIIREQAARVWAHVQNDTEPPASAAAIDYLKNRHPVGENDLDLASDSDGDLLEESRALAVEYSRGAAAEKAGKAAKDAAKARIMQITGDHEQVLAEGAKLWSYKNSGKFMPSTFQKLATDEELAAAQVHQVVIPAAGAGQVQELHELIKSWNPDLEPVHEVTVDGKLAEAAAPEKWKASRVRTLLVAKPKAAK